MDSKSERGQILIECLFALGFLMLMMTYLQKEWDQERLKKTMEKQRIYNFQNYKSERL